jgi:hypothetical protein
LDGKHEAFLLKETESYIPPFDSRIRRLKGLTEKEPKNFKLGEGEKKRKTLVSIFFRAVLLNHSEQCKRKKKAKSKNIQKSHRGRSPVKRMGQKKEKMK